ncbi:hypothetical protein FPV67DRAFT_1480869 [Lyophyllum atratum]|nr:hypothetical protein FPV67DRAFT_1480869 [Lyophyllum atratum]
MTITSRLTVDPTTSNEMTFTDFQPWATHWSCLIIGAVSSNIALFVVIYLCFQTETAFDVFSIWSLSLILVPHVFAKSERVLAGLL